MPLAARRCRPLVIASQIFLIFFLWIMFTKTSSYRTRKYWYFTRKNKETWQTVIANQIKISQPAVMNLTVLIWRMKGPVSAFLCWSVRLISNIWALQSPQLLLHSSSLFRGVFYVYIMWCGTEHNTIDIIIIIILIWLLF